MCEFNLVITRRDITAVSKLAKQIWNNHYLSIIGQDQIDYMLLTFQSEQAIIKQLDDGFKYFLVKKQNQTAGYFAVTDNKKSNTVQISKLYINSRFQNCGIGSAIISFIERSHINTLDLELWLTVNRENKQAIHFYQKEGFQKSGCIVQDIGQGFVMDDYKMVKVITLAEVNFSAMT